MTGGESIVIGARDYSIAIAAKSWQVQAPDLQDLPVTNAAEQHTIDNLRAVGARNVAVAEPAWPGWQIGSIMFQSPHALGAIATVGPTTDFDPMVPITSDGETTLHDIDGVVVRTTIGTELGSELYEAGFVCGGYGWRLEAILGSPAELIELSELLIESQSC
jgi:hypothetical protein